MAEEVETGSGAMGKLYGRAQPSYHLIPTALKDNAPLTAPATIFLGAGASAAFGYPTTKGFMDQCRTTVKGKEGELLSTLVEVPNISDVEPVLDILDQIVTTESPILKYLEYRQVQLPTKPSYFGVSNSSWNDFKKLADSLRRMIHEELFRQYQFDPKKADAIRKLYHETLNAISKDASIAQVFTTNYDSLIEEALAGSKEFALTDGFHTSQYNAVWDGSFDTTGVKFGLKGRYVCLYKLHGSLSWRTDKDSGNIVRVGTEEKATGYSKKLGENILLYPASKSPPIADPYGILYSHFSNKLNSTNICVVIGFSFRDPFINTVFIDYLRRSQGNVIIIVSPSADECAKSLLGSLESSPLGERVIKLPNKFGDPYTTALIKATIEKRLSAGLGTSGNNIPV